MFSCHAARTERRTGILTAGSNFDPVTPYAHSKVLVGKGMAGCGQEGFGPTYLGIRLLMECRSLFALQYRTLNNLR